MQEDSFSAAWGMGPSSAKNDSGSEESNSSSHQQQHRTTYRRKKTVKAPRKRTFIDNMTRTPKIESDARECQARGTGSGGGGGGGGGWGLGAAVPPAFTRPGDGAMAPFAFPAAASAPAPAGAAAANSAYAVAASQQQQQQQQLDALPVIRPAHVPGMKSVTSAMMPMYTPRSLYSVVTTETGAAPFLFGVRRQAVVSGLTVAPAPAPPTAQQQQQQAYEMQMRIQQHQMVQAMKQREWAAASPALSAASPATSGASPAASAVSGAGAVSPRGSWSGMSGPQNIIAQQASIEGGAVSSSPPPPPITVLDLSMAPTPLVRMQQQQQPSKTGMVSRGGSFNSFPVPAAAPAAAATYPSPAALVLNNWMSEDWNDDANFLGNGGTSATMMKRKSEDIVTYPFPQAGEEVMAKRPRSDLPAASSLSPATSAVLAPAAVLPAWSMMEQDRSSPALTSHSSGSGSELTTTSSGVAASGGDDDENIDALMMQMLGGAAAAAAAATEGEGDLLLGEGEGFDWLFDDNQELPFSLL